jgi:DNA-binding NtrC family response regulator
MAKSFLQRLFGQKERGSDAGSLSFTETMKSPVKPGKPSSDVADQEDRKPLESRPPEQNAGAKRKINSLFAFVDPKDPFTAGEIVGEEFPGPILSILSARQFNFLFLFHTPHTRDNALATQKEVSRRYPDCQVRMHELSVADPKDYSSLMGRLARIVRILMKLPKTGEPYVCVSSGTAEMRAAWFLLTALGVLPAKLLQVGSPGRPLFGEANVKEVRMDTSDWQTIRELAMPAQYWFDLEDAEALSKKPIPPGAPRLGAPWPRRVAKRSASTQDAAAKPDEATEEKLRSFGSEFEGSPQILKELIQRGPLDVPALDDALQELGIYVGSAVLRHAAEQSSIAAGSHLPVLLLGETGTGKERFAHLIHRLSPRFPRELVAINCAAIPESLAESYLFGHLKGAFTGADRDKKGMFESADQSTLFLDEIAELTLEIQAKLLRVIQDGVVQRLGSMAPRKVDVRIIAASNRDLRREVSAGRFREDLYFRLEVVQIKLPALRERRHEIPELALALLRKINQRRHKPIPMGSDAFMRLESHDWPGNVRELSNVLERSVLYARGWSIGADDLLITDHQPAKDLFATLPEPCQGFKVEEYLTQVRKQLFLRALAACKGNQTEAAEQLGVSKQAVSKFLAGQNDNFS